MKNAYEYIKTFAKWIFFAIIVGATGGVVGSLFHHSIDYVTSLRERNFWLIFLLPVGGLIISVLYGFFKKKENIDTNRVIESVNNEKTVPLIMTPLIFISSVITHLLGGSAGREGAALQLGGSIGYNTGRLFRLKEENLHIVVMTGMSAVFSALFGTPATASVFAVEVIGVGAMHYSALLPCVVSSTVAYFIARFGFSISPVAFDVVFPEILPDLTVIKVVILAALCALVSIVFCSAIKLCEKYMKKFIPNGYLRGVVGGAAIVLLTFIVGTYDYNGAGMNIIEKAVSGAARPEAFALKIIFTAVTIAAGFKGGEIVPTLFIGSTFGCVLGAVLGIDPGFGAAIGMIALFCGVTNCPIASLILSIELFGGQSVVFFAVVCGVSFMLSGYSGLYKSQKFVISKLNDEYININTK